MEVRPDPSRVELSLAGLGAVGLHLPPPLGSPPSFEPSQTGGGGGPE